MPENNEEKENIKNEMMEKDLKAYEYVENLKNYFAIFKKENNLFQMEKLLKEIETNYGQYIENYHLKILKEDVESAKQSKKNFLLAVKKIKKEINVAIGKSQNPEEISELIDRFEELLNGQDANVVEKKVIEECKKVLKDFRSLVEAQPDDASSDETSSSAHKQQLKEKYNKDKGEQDEVLLRSVLNEIDRLTHDAELRVIREQLRSPKTSENVGELRRGLERMRQWSWSGHLLTEEDEDLYVEVKSAVEKLERCGEDVEANDGGGTEKAKSSEETEKDNDGSERKNLKAKSNSNEVSVSSNDKSVKSDKSKNSQNTKTENASKSEEKVHCSAENSVKSKEIDQNSSGSTYAKSVFSKQSKRSHKSKKSNSTSSEKNEKNVNSRAPSTKSQSNKSSSDTQSVKSNKSEKSQAAEIVEIKRADSTSSLKKRS